MDLQLEDFSLDDLQEFMQTEQYEQLDELSKTTLGNYIKGASKHAQTLGSNASNHFSASAEYDTNYRSGKGSLGDKTLADKHKKSGNEASYKALTRQQGIAKAVKKLTETDQLDEASKHFEAGQWAVLKGKKYSDNPHPAGSKEHSEWSKGHNDMRAKRANEQAEELKEAYEVTIKHVHPDGKKEDFVYKINKAETGRHAKHIAFKIHTGKKIPGTSETSSQMVKNLDETIDLEMNESLEHDHIQQSLADKDINSKIHQGKVQVHKSNVAKAKAHVEKLGHKIEVVGGLNEDISDYSLEELKEFLVSEEYEQLDELSKTTLGNYIKKASDNNYGHGVMSMHLKNTADYQDSIGNEKNAEINRKASSQHTNDYIKRSNGIQKAVSKLTKESLEDYSLEELQEILVSEEYEQLDELSKTTLGNYIKKATNNISNVSRHIGMPGETSAKPEYRKELMMHVNKRTDGITKAVKKLTEDEIIRESIEDLINNIRAGKTSDAISKFEDLAKVKSMEEIEQLKSAMRQRIYNNYAGVPAETDDSDD